MSLIEIRRARMEWDVLNMNNMCNSLNNNTHDFQVNSKVTACRLSPNGVHDLEIWRVHECFPTNETGTHF